MHVLAIHSYAVLGTASLKAILSLLGSQVLPVPSLMLTGLTNIPGIRKFYPPFEEILVGTLELVRARKEQVILYIGYLGSVEQVELIKAAIATYRLEISAVVVDPVSGDQGRLYVPEEIVRVWPDLLSVADWALPNRTEALLMTQQDMQANLSGNEIMSAFSDQFPHLSFAITSLEVNPDITIGIWDQGQVSFVSHAHVSQHFGGTGDVFAAHFIHFHWKNGLGAFESISKAAHATLACIRHSAAKKQEFLLLTPLT